MVNHIVVTLIHTSCIGAVTFHKCNFIINSRVWYSLECIPDIECPSVRMINIKSFCRKITGVNVGTVKHTDCTCTFRRIFRLELIFAAEGTDFNRLCFTHKPHHKVYVVAAFCKQHCCVAFFWISPLTAYIGCWQMVVWNMLCCLNINYVTDFTVCNSFFDGIVKRCVSQNVTDHNLRIVLFSAFNKLAHFFFINGKRLFKKHIISCIQKRNGCFDMLFIHSSVNNGVCKFTLFCKLLGWFKAHILAKTEIFHTMLSSDRIRVCNTYNF